MSNKQMNLPSHNSFPLVKVELVFVYVICEFIVIWSVFDIVPVFVESYSQFFSSVADINIPMYLKFCCVTNVFKDLIAVD